MSETPKTDEKYKELYTLSNKLLEDEQARFNRADEKSMKYLSGVTLMVGLSLAVANDSVKASIPPSGFSDGIVLVLSITLLASLSVSWFLVFLIFKIRPLRAKPLNQEMLELFKNQNSATIYVTIAKGNAKALEENRSVTDKKYKELDRAHNLILFSATVFILFICAAFGKTWHDSPHTKQIQPMSEKNKTPTDPIMLKSNKVDAVPIPANPEPKPTAINDPNFDINSPEYIFLANEKKRVS